MQKPVPARVHVHSASVLKFNHPSIIVVWVTCYDTYGFALLELNELITFVKLENRSGCRQTQYTQRITSVKPVLLQQGGGFHRGARDGHPGLAGGKQDVAAVRVCTPAVAGA